MTRRDRWIKEVVKVRGKADRFAIDLADLLAEAENYGWRKGWLWAWAANAAGIAGMFAFRIVFNWVTSPAN